MKDLTIDEIVKQSSKLYEKNMSVELIKGMIAKLAQEGSKLIRMGNTVFLTVNNGMQSQILFVSAEKPKKLIMQLLFFLLNLATVENKRSAVFEGNNQELRKFLPLIFKDSVSILDKGKSYTATFDLPKTLSMGQGVAQ